VVLRAVEAPPDNPISGVYPIELEGTVNLGAFYGSVPIAGMSVENAKKAISNHLKRFIRNPAIEIALAQGRGMQQVQGTHLVRQDGAVNLGSYGQVRVVGMTVTQAKQALEQHLSKFFQDPEVSLDVAGYNSKVYYVIFDGGGAGQQMIRAPLTGNETVLDAIGQIGGLSPISNERRMWITRPRPLGAAPTILPIDWRAITETGDTGTNYQLLAGDRIFVKAYPAITIGTRIDRAIAPIERMFGFVLLGTGVVRSLENSNQGGIGGF
jgi:polysaccharide biosynthesis/export protein